MVNSLHIENIAVVKSLDVEFSSGMTVLSGETGAGKSIIIDSISLLLGAKADKELIRTGEQKASVSAVFTDVGEAVQNKMNELGIECEDGTIMLARTLTQSSSAARINGRGVTASMLREIGGMLIGIHGQNDNQQLMEQKNHVRLLDNFSVNGERLSEYTEEYRRITSIRARIAEIKNDAMERARLGEMLKFQINDIDVVKLKRGEEEALEELVKKLQSAEKISRACALADKAITGSEKMHGAAYLVTRAAEALESVSDAVSGATELSKRLWDVSYELEDIAECAKDINDFGEIDVLTSLDKAQSRLNAISKLKRKYGSTVEEILDFRASAAQRLSAIENSGEILEELEDELNGAVERANKLAATLTAARREGARRLSKRVCETLTFLDMPKVRFEVSVTPTDDFNSTGRDRVEFLIATNAGEPLMPMEKIASGGELARIMLSLKNVLNECDGLKTVIFDEIDTGISGKTSRKVGIKLKEIAGTSQVLCVTHSAQIASLAHNHLRIFKTDDGERVSTSLTLLDREGRIEEISRILGGIEITETVREAAEEMIREGETYP
ncbi:MAG: DNA repair protein RecN [Ruminococcaceae bacterium]|nr:DNA repair protein RecN [Oscillospiraceae bacterium]